jgi:hypothetical protein
MRLAYFCIFFFFFTLMIASARDTEEIKFSADNQCSQSVSPNSGIVCMPPETGISLKRIIGTSIARDNFHEPLLKSINFSRINIPVRKRSFRVYSFITFLIALLGLLGLTQFQARKMTKEISIRKIHGAGRMDTFRRFTKGYLQIIMISNALSVPVSQWVMNKWLAHFQYRAEADPFIFLKTLIITSFFTLLAVSFFIMRAYYTDPLKTLKYE